jgi:hypothetical protein
MLRVAMLRTAVAIVALFTIGLSGSAAHAAVAQYNATLIFGFGDGSPGPGGTPNTANNAVLGCAAIGVTTSQFVNPEGSVVTGYNAPPGAAAEYNFRGVANILTASPTGSIQLYNETPANGFRDSCVNAGNVAGNPFLTRLTNSGSLSFPGPRWNYPVSPGNIAGTWSLGGGGGSTTHTVPWRPASAQFMQVAAGPNQFGGSIAINGFTKTVLGINDPAGTIVGVLPVPINHGVSSSVSGMPQVPRVPALSYTSGSSFWAKFCGSPVPLSGYHGTGCPVLLPINASVAALPWTSGTAIAYNTVGQFNTRLTATGGQSRTLAGANGTLQLVAPAVLEVKPLANPLGVAIMADMTLTFVPEPASGMLLVAGALGVVGIHAVRRRSKN